MILRFLRKVLAGGPVYLRVNRDRVSARNVATGESVELVPKIGLSAANDVLSIGDPVDPAAVRVLKPFRHPRILIDDFTAGERIVQHVIRELSRVRFFPTSPVVVVHPDAELEGGLTQIEARALREMVEGAGARKVYIYVGRQLTDEEVANGAFEDWDSVSDAGQ